MQTGWRASIVILTGVSTHICAAHRDTSGQLHGHTWTVKAFFPDSECALVLKARLEAACALFDHQELLGDLARGEGLADAIAEQLPDAVQIDLDRPAEGIFVRWSA